jgi:hypothetical protein
MCFTHEFSITRREHGCWSLYRGDSSRNQSFDIVYHLNYCCFSTYDEILPMKNTRYVVLVAQKEVEKDDLVSEDDSSDESIHSSAGSEITDEDDESEDINNYRSVHLFIEIYDLLEEKFVRRTRCVCFSLLPFSSLLITILWCLVEIT